MKLKRCPFCGSAKVNYYTSVTQMDETTGQEYDSEGDVQCYDCHASGPYVLVIGNTDVRRYAIDAWNKRAGDQTT